MSADPISAMSDPSRLPPSLWAATAIDGPEYHSLAGEITCDIAIVGAGFTGLTTALSAAENGATVAVIEAGEPGWGASGRNGGQVNAALKTKSEDIIAQYGEEAAAKIKSFAASAPEVVFDLVKKHKIDCGTQRSGLLFCVASEAYLPYQRATCDEWSQQGAPVRWADREETAALTGSPDYHGAMVDMRCGKVQPLSYARGLARAAIKAGAKIYARTKAISLSSTQDGWELKTQNGVVKAGKVVLATNGYSGYLAKELSPDLDRSIIPVSSFIIATEPLSDNLRRSILAEGHCTADTRRFLYYTRLDDEGRLVFGGRGLLRDPKSAKDFDHLRLGLAKVFPQARDVPIQYSWSGRLALTPDGVPHLHEPVPGLLMALGYNGRGVAAASALGTAIGAYASANDPSALPFPPSKIDQIPFHSLREPFMAIAFAWNRAMDRLGW
ncbi:MAG: NAD(P)/FAD-dependent oxidoreductase [Hyphomicrobiales bacterium]